MSSEYAIRSSPNTVERRTTGQWRTAAVVCATLAGILLVIALALVGVHVVTQLDSMASNLPDANRYS